MGCMSRIRGPYVRFCERDEAVTPHPTRFASDVVIKDRFELAKDELRLGYSEAFSALGEETIRLNESSASKVKTAIQTVAATVEVIRKYNEQRTDLARMYQVLKGVRTTIADLGSNIKKRTRDLLTRRAVFDAINDANLEAASTAVKGRIHINPSPNVHPRVGGETIDQHQ
jgi:hypothetical protein